jgi:hypothetical protein
MLINLIFDSVPNIESLEMPNCIDPSVRISQLICCCSYATYVLHSSFNDNSGYTSGSKSDNNIHNHRNQAFLTSLEKQLIMSIQLSSIENTYGST